MVTACVNNKAIFVNTISQFIECQNFKLCSLYVKHMSMPVYFKLEKILLLNQ